MTSRDNAKRWVIFDLDGTLVDSLPALYGAYQRFLKDHGCRGTRSEFSMMNGPSFQEIVNYLKKKHSLKGGEEILKAGYLCRVKELYWKMARRAVGSSTILKRLKRKGYKIGLATAAPRYLAEPVILKYRWNRLFDRVTYGSEVIPGKPDPAIFLKAIEKTGRGPSDVIVVEDSKNGVRSAKAAGAYVVGLSNGSDKKALYNAGAQRVVSSLKEVESEVGAKNFWSQKVIPLDQKKRLSIRLTVPVKPVSKEMIFCIDRFVQKHKTLEIEGRFVSYREYLTRRGSRENPIAVLAVNAITVFDGVAEEKILIGKRGPRVHCHRGLWEFPPAGGIDTQCLGERGRINWKKMLLMELREETGIRSSEIANIKPLGLIADPLTAAYDIFCEIRLRSAQKPKETVCAAEEHSAMQWKSRREISRMLDNPGEIVPTLPEMWEIYQKQRKGSR